MPLPSRVDLPDGRVLLLEEVRVKGEHRGFRSRLEGPSPWGPIESDMRVAAAATAGLPVDEAWQAIKNEFVAQAGRRATTTGGQVYVTKGLQVRGTPEDPNALK